MEQVKLKLYITGSTLRSRQAIANLEEICAREWADRHELIVIDVLERPELARDDKILATPTLIKAFPPPIQRIIGDLSDTEQVLLGLDLQPHAPQGETAKGGDAS